LYDVKGSDKAADSDVCDACQTLEIALYGVSEQDRSLVCPLKDGFVAEDCQILQCESATELMPSIRVSIEEGCRWVTRLERFKDSLRDKGCGKGGVASGEAFCEGDKIRSNAFVFAGEHFAGSPEARHDFVCDEENVVGTTPFVELAEHAFRPEAHSVRSLDEGFNHDGCERGGVVLEELSEGRHVTDRRVVLLEPLKKQGDTSQAGCAEGVTVVGARE
jgi:hypothetical protein